MTDINRYLVKPACISAIASISNHFIHPQQFTIGNAQYRSEIVLGISVFIAEELINVAQQYIYPTFLSGEGFKYRW